MKFCYSIFLTAFLFQASFAQVPGAMWQGKIRLETGRKQELTFRLELLTEGNRYFGMLYTRGSEKGSVYGCDYIVDGLYAGNLLELRKLKVVRSVGVPSDDCDEFGFLRLRNKEGDSMSVLSGQWFWLSTDYLPISCTKISNEISPIAIDEIVAYRAEVYNFYEEKKVYLPPEQRWNKLVYQTEVDSTDLIVDLVSASASVNDSVQIFFNGEAIADSYSLNKGQLRFRIRAIEKGENEIVIINTSAASSKIFFNIGFTQQGKTKNSSGEISFVRNAVFILKRSE